MKKLLLGLSFSLLASTSYAADAIVEEVAVEVPSVFVWTGGYVGLQAGYAWGDGYVDQTNGDGFIDLEPDGFLGGIYAGYNYQMPNNVVLGAEIDVVYADVDGSAQAFDGPGDPDDLIGEQELNWSGAARLRLGYAVDRFLPYIAGGVAFGDIDLTATEPGDPTTSFGDTYVGWTIGGGFDYAFTDNILFRAEYRYTDFGSETFESFNADMDLETNEVRFGIAYKF